MSRTTSAADRLAVLVLGLVLAVAGLALVAWYLDARGWLPVDLSAPGRLDTGAVDTAATSSWWPWALGLVGVVLVLVGLRWLAAHLPDRGIGRLRVAGSTSADALEADAGGVVGAAAAALEQTEGIRSARGTVRRERGQVVATLHATLEQGADLGTVSRACDTVSADLAGVLGRDDLRCSVRLHVAHRDRPLRRVS